MNGREIVELGIGLVFVWSRLFWVVLAAEASTKAGEGSRVSVPVMA